MLSLSKEPTLFCFHISALYLQLLSFPPNIIFSIFIEFINFLSKAVFNCLHCTMHNCKSNLPKMALITAIIRIHSFRYKTKGICCNFSRWRLLVVGFFWRTPQLQFCLPLSALIVHLGWLKRGTKCSFAQPSAKCHKILLPQWLGCIFLSVRKW